ncbi:EAL domain-containing protein [Thiorhodococcus minor]|uniref:cyclic-guanylate-specific phosphodiesterase n=1 Tax=Thiorhodococcus minor TaxID=57489 RepID=A0A6M0K233_9GAMM|nr:EAL domain-containing protein [Thiorhodococcus minor]NEV63394.1 EAL domain-containing protein [Thiorhodococcus minor]
MSEPSTDEDPRDAVLEALELPTEQVKARALAALRQKRFDLAEQLLRKEDISARALVENLRIYQAELEIQNEELIRSHAGTQEALMRFTALFQGLPVASLVIDRQGLVKESNGAAQKLFNLEASHLRQHFFSRMIGAEDRGSAIDAWSKLGSTQRITLEGIRFNDGTEAGFLGDLHIAPLPGAHGDLSQFVCAVLDRSEAIRQRLELIETGARLRHSEAALEERLKELAALHDVLIETTGDGHSEDSVLQRVVDRLPQAWQFPELAEAAIRLPDAGFQTPGFAPTAWSQSTRFPVDGDREGEICVAYRTPPFASELPLFLDEEQALLDAVGRHVAAFLARRRDEARLRDSMESFQVLAEHNPEWEYWLEPSGRYRYVSPACSAVSGYDAAAFLADPDLFRSLVHPEDLADWDRHIAHTQTREAISSEGSLMQLRIVDRHGQIRWIEHVCKAVIAADGRYLGRRGVNRDITERKAAERLAARMTSLYDALSRCSQAIVRCCDEASLLGAVCKIAVELEGVRACAIMLATEEGQGPHVTAVQGISAELAEQLGRRVTRDRRQARNGLVEHASVRDVLDQAADDEGLASLAEQGLRTAGIYPLRRDGRPLGAMHLYAEEEDFFAPDITGLLEEMAADVSLALDGFAQERARRAAEARVMERERHLSAIFRAARVGIGVSQDRVIREANQSLCDMLGYPGDALIGVDARALYCSDAAYREVGAEPPYAETSPAVRAVETQWCRRDGRPLDVLISACPLDTDNPERGLVVTALDITERKEFQDALERSEELLNATGRLAKVGGWELYPISQRLNLTEVAREILEVEPARVARLTDLAPLVDPRDRPKLQAANRDAIAQGHPYDLQVRLAGRDDRQTWLQLTCQPVLSDGRIDRLVGAVQDITARVEAEKSLRQAARVFESTADGVVITDPDERILAVNKAFTEITGYAEEEVLGETPRILKSGRHPAAFYQAMWRSLEETGFWRGEIWNLHKNEEVYPELMTISAVLDGADEITHYVGVFRDISHIKRSEEQLAYLAHHDALTGLPNRSLFQLRLEHCIQRSSRNRRKAALLFIDLDRFKVINDTLGHLFGDAVLKRAAESLALEVRAEDTIARLGGDEFVIVLEEIARPDDAAVFAERILQIFSQPFHVHGRDLFVTASIGVSIYPDDGHDIDTLLRHADISMYRAKDKGRNAFALFEPSMAEGAEDRFRLETDLRRAIEREELAVHYQPQIRLADGQLIGVEALCRWQHPELGPIAPARFIPLAEDIGMIDQLGTWVLGESCRQLAAWDGQGFRIPRLAVNLSVHQLEGRRLVDRVRAVLVASGVSAERLELEVTESTIMRHPERAVEALRDLRALGITLAIDDFGTGYSSLDYLKRLPLHRLKINRSFVEHLTQDDNDDAIVRAVIALGDSLGLETLAEGVETEEQAGFLRQEGCLESQGYLFGRPLPPEALAAAWA